MRLSDYLREQLVVHGLGVSDMDGVLDGVGAHLVASGLLSSRDEVIQALRAREEAHTTVLGEGVAVPHATLPSLQELLLMVVQAGEPVLFGPQEVGPVDLFFVLLSPPGREGEHIKLLARICRLARHPGFLDALRAAPDARSMLETLRRVDAEHV